MKTKYQNDIIHMIRTIRTDHNISQKMLAQILGVTPGQVGNIESPHSPNKYTLAQIFCICNEFNISIKNIFIQENEYNQNEDIINLLISKIIKYEYER